MKSKQTYRKSRLAQPKCYVFAGFFNVPTEGKQFFVLVEFDVIEMLLAITANWAHAKTRRAVLLDDVPMVLDLRIVTLSFPAIN
jgi:hypothetical protein